MKHISVQIRCLPILLWLMFVLGCGRDTADRLLAQLGDADPQVRQAAARQLAQMPGHSQRVIDALSQAGANSDVEVRAIAVDALGKKGVEAREVYPALRQALADSQENVRLKAGLAIHAIAPNDASFRPVLLESLRAGDGPIFLEVGRMGADGRWAAPTLVALLSDRRASIRALSANTLGQIGDSSPEVQKALQRATRDGNAAVRDAAKISLTCLGSQPADRVP
jgi:HEAT repeat protein